MRGELQRRVRFEPAQNGDVHVIIEAQDFFGGRIAGMSSRTIGRYERDEKEPVATVLGRIALALETTTDYLVGLRDDPTVPEPDSPTRVSLNAVA